MAVKLSKKQVKEMSNKELLRSFELCVVESVKECNSIRGESKATIQSNILLRAELADRLGIEDVDHNIF